MTRLAFTVLALAASHLLAGEPATPSNANRTTVEANYSGAVIRFRTPSGQMSSARLCGIKPIGDAGKDYLERLLSSGPTAAREHGRDQLSQRIVTVFVLHESNWHNVNRLLILNGELPFYHGDGRFPELDAAERSAKMLRKGFWAFQTDPPADPAALIAAAAIAKRQAVEEAARQALLAREAARQAIIAKEAAAGYKPDLSAAFVMSQSVVRKMLKSPSTASFGGWFTDHQSYTETTTYLGDRIYQIDAWVDSQNGFGAMLRKNFTCKVRHNHDDTWQGLSCTIHE